jgi:molecular chaperone GrpE (heat shock protein)
MNATADLIRLFAEWRRLTERESQAILSDDWKGAARHQNQKEQLQEEMTRAIERIRSSDESASGEEQRRFHSVASELAALETRNRDLLRDKRQRRQAEVERLNQTTRDLHGVRRAYGSNTAPHWQSYS